MILYLHDPDLSSSQLVAVKRMHVDDAKIISDKQRRNVGILFSGDKKYGANMEQAIRREVKIWYATRCISSCAAFSTDVAI